MLDMLSGLAVILISFCVVSPLVWWLMKDEQIQLDRVSTADTQVIHRPHADELGDGTVATERTLILDVRPVDDERQPMMDELGEWRPWEHDTAQPLLLGHVLMSHEWHALDAKELGWVAA